ncbi:MAG: response regulator [Armatimonadetes bacterium]|nr:response regulator [Armatimonadota bacterium]
MAKRILVVEDAEDIRQILTLALDRAGYQVFPTASGFEGIEIASGVSPDLILLDLMLPDLDGFHVCRALKSNSLTRGIPVFMLTARSQRGDRFWGRTVGAEEYIAKPFDLPDLLNLIRKKVG